MLNVITPNEISRAVAQVLPVLQVPCTCKIMQSTSPCGYCQNRGWIPTISLSHIITNLEYPFTLVLSNDMIGWCAEIVLDGDTPTGKDKKAYDDQSTQSMRHYLKR